LASVAADSSFSSRIAVNTSAFFDRTSDISCCSKRVTSSTFTASRKPRTPA
jgi:hypothetical protein